MSEGPLFLEWDPRHQRATYSNSPICLCAPFKLAVTFQLLPVWPQQGTKCVWMQFAAVLGYACSLTPTWNPDQFVLTYNVLGATGTPLELLDVLSDPCGFNVRGLNADTPEPLISSLLPCHLVPHGTNKLSVSLLGVLCWDWLKWEDCGWPCCDMLTDSRT